MTEKHVEQNVALERMQGFWQKFQKPLLIIVAIIVIGGGGWFAYREYIAKPKNEKAAEAIYKAEQYFALDSSKLVLNGDGQSRGVLYIMSNYSGTPSANLAHYYAGVSYLKLGDFNNAVKYLKDFSSDAKQIELKALGCLGDAYSELNQKDNAISSYKKAASVFDTDENNSSEYLFRAALLAETTGDTKQAVDLYKELRDKFPRTDKGVQADKYITRLTVEKN